MYCIVTKLQLLIIENVCLDLDIELEFDFFIIQTINWESMYLVLHPFTNVQNFKGGIHKLLVPPLANGY